MNTTSANGTSCIHTHKASLGGIEAFFTLETMKVELDKLVAKAGGGVPSIVELMDDGMVPPSDDFRDLAAELPGPVSRPEPIYSDFGDGKQIVDETAKARIEQQHATLAQAGLDVGEKHQLFATGARMAKVGYDNQAGRKVEHDEQRPLAEAAAELTSRVLAERRVDQEITAGELAAKLTVERGVRVFGRSLTEQAIRGLLARLESPALSYVLGLRDRAGVNARGGRTRTSESATRSETAQIAEVLDHELRARPDVTLKLRTRETQNDVFAIVSPSFAPADAPAVLAEILGSMPGDARGTYAYDPISTSWELRASVWTPTPVDEQAVGEAFRGYVSFSARDNGTSRLRGGGGVELLACLNASTYTAAGADVSRVHRGAIMTDVAAMLAGSLKAISALCAAWGVAREAEIRSPELVGVPVSKAIQGLWWGELLDRRSELAGVLPGRSATHVEALTKAYLEERRDPEKLVRADMAQGWTRYIQEQPTAVRREAESAIGRWLVSPSPVRFDARAIEA